MSGMDKCISVIDRMNMELGKFLYSFRIKIQIREEPLSTTLLSCFRHLEVLHSQAFVSMPLLLTQ